MTVDSRTPAGAAPQPVTDSRFSTMSVIGFILAFAVPLAGIAVSIVALVQARKTGQRTGFAVAGVAVSVLGILFIIGCLALILPSVLDLFGMCAELGLGTHAIDGATYTCGLLGSSVVFR